MAQYESKTKQGNCIFCEIVKGNIKSPGIFWEDEKHMAFLTPFPNTEGFTVVIPKKHFKSDVLNMPNKNLKELIMASKEVSKILTKHFQDVGRVGLIIEGLGIDHAHTKLIPMHKTEHLKEGKWIQAVDKREEFFSEYPGYITSIEGPRISNEEIKLLADKLKEIKI